MGFFVFVCLGGFFCVPQLYLWGSPLLGEIFAFNVLNAQPTSMVISRRERRSPQTENDL